LVHESCLYKIFT